MKINSCRKKPENTYICAVWNRRYAREIVPSNIRKKKKTPEQMFQGFQYGSNTFACNDV